MATRAAIASADRKSRERIAEADRSMKDKISKRELKQKEQQMEREHIRGSAQAAGQVLRGISGFMHNDPDWYKKFNLSEAMAKVPTFFRTGKQLYPGWLFMNTANTQSHTDVLPGVCVFRYAPTLPNGYDGAVTPGSGAYQFSPINASLTRFMAELRKLNSRIGDYDPSDIGFYMYALSDIMEDILNLVKAIKLYNTWYAENANFARVLIKACGFDPDNFIANYNEYKAFAIKSIQRFNASAVLPKTLTFLLRRAWMASVVIRDHDSNTAQLYMYRKGYNVTLVEDESYLQVVSVSGLYNNYVTFISSIETRMSHIFNSVGMVTITADLRAAFEQKDLIFINESGITDPITYSDSITDLEQIHNTITLPCQIADFMKVNTVPNALTRTNISQDASGYLFQGAISGGAVTPVALVDSSYSTNAISALSWGMCYDDVGNEKKFLNFYKSSSVTEDDVLEATRCRVLLHSVSNLGRIIHYCGTEVIQYGEIWVNDVPNGSIDYYGFTTDVVSDAYNLINEDSKSVLDRFDWLPCYRHITCDGTNTYYNTFGEIDHAVIIGNENLKWLHEGAAFSEFFIDSNQFNFVRH